MSWKACLPAFAALLVLGFWSAPASACIPGSCVPVSTNNSCLICVLHPPSVPTTTITCVQLGPCRCVTAVCVPPRQPSSASTDWRSAVLGSEAAEPAPATLPF